MNAAIGRLELSVTVKHPPTARKETGSRVQRAFEAQRTRESVTREREKWLVSGTHFHRTII